MEGLLNFFDSIFKKDNDLKKMNFSLEIGPHTDLETLPPVKDVYITMLPGGDYKETADKSGDLVKKGFNPVPHFPARSISNDKELIKVVDLIGRNTKIEHKEIQNTKINLLPQALASRLGQWAAGNSSIRLILVFCIPDIFCIPEI